MKKKKAQEKLRGITVSVEGGQSEIECQGRTQVKSLTGAKNEGNGLRAGPYGYL